MGLMVDAIINPVLFEEEKDTGLVWKNIDLDERIQADPKYMDRV